jgi:hypothetical protein
MDDQSRSFTPRPFAVSPPGMRDRLAEVGRRLERLARGWHLTRRAIHYPRSTIHYPLSTIHDPLVRRFARDHWLFMGSGSAGWLRESGSGLPQSKGAGDRFSPGRAGTGSPSHGSWYNEGVARSRLLAAQGDGKGFDALLAPILGRVGQGLTVRLHGSDTGARGLEPGIKLALCEFTRGVWRLSRNIPHGVEGSAGLRLLQGL